MGVHYILRAYTQCIKPYRFGGDIMGGCESRYFFNDVGSLPSFKEIPATLLHFAEPDLFLVSLLILDQW